MDHNCKNFDVCGKITDTRLDLCGSCYWEFHEVLTFGTSVDCPICLDMTGPSVKYQTCNHYVCTTCFKKRRENKCPLCRCENKSHLDKVLENPDAHPSMIVYRDTAPS